ncbi:MAG: radical SAM protein [Actinobacteria bacterium]|nr:radical SAM protein [Actinomycetota bacterium]
MASVAPAPRPNCGRLRDLATNPMVVAWEVTRACGYACRHCRADAQPRPMIGELDHDEAMDLVCALGRFEGTTLVLTGGDPLLRADLVEIAQAARGHGLRVALTPSATARVTPGRLRELTDAGVDRLAISIDGATPEAHDAMRGRRGSFERSLRILGWAREAGFSTQMNTTITRFSAGDLDRMAELVRGLDADMWSAFFLVPVGRAPRTDMLDADGHEVALHRLAEISEHVPFRVKVTEAPQYRRILMQTGRADNMPPAVNGGRGFMFISHDGHISPSGFLPLGAGDVRRDDPVEVYRMSPVFRDVRDTAQLQGKCGVCEFRSMCGGSRARAYALTGDALAEDPTCAYRPTGWH